MKKLFGTDGIRGIANDFLTYGLAMSVGEALGEILSKRENVPKVIIGTDTRESGEMLKNALGNGLTRLGCEVLDVGVVSTPAVAFLTTSTHSDAGVMISASHNPFEYNGIKIFGKEGFKLSDEDEEIIEGMIYENLPKKSTPQNPGKMISAKNLKDDYVNYLRSFAPESFDNLSVVIDCANGSAANTAKEIFNFPGLNVKFIGCEPNGTNINLECGSTHLEILREEVLKSNANLGIAFDGDADRCLAIDENGNEVDGDFIMAILSLMLKENNMLHGNTVVGTVMSNYGFSKFCRDFGINFVATKVGDRYVLEEIEKCAYNFGGEQSGHIILRNAATTGDGQLTALYLLSRMNETKKKLSELASVMKKFPQHMVNISATPSQKAAFGTSEKIAEVLENANKTLKNTGRILVRPSGTEPLVRIMVESSDAKLTVSLCKSVAENIKEILSSVED